jgi:hypothetical protein
MKNQTILLAFGFVFAFYSLIAQSPDTVIISPKNINTKALIEGKHEWLVFIQPNGQSRKSFSLWQRTIQFSKYQGKDAIVIKQVWEDNDSIVHTVETVCNKVDFATLYQKGWTKGQGDASFDFQKKEAIVNGSLLLPTNTARNKRRVFDAFQKATTQYFINWHLDLEVFASLPYRENRVFAINFYDPGFNQPKVVYYAVKGSSKLKSHEGSEINCWVMSVEQGPSSQTFWISKNTHEVLKMVANQPGQTRYKIKLGVIAES